MPWFRIDDDLPQHVKMDALEAAAGSWEVYAAARTLWEDMGCDCSRRRTDGRFARARALRVCRLPPDVIDRALAALVTAGFLELDAGEYRYHDWADYQPTKAELDEQRKAATERQRKRRLGLSQRDTAVTHAVTTTVTPAVSHEASRRESQGESRPASHERGAPTSAVRVTAPRPVPSRPVPEVQNSELVVSAQSAPATVAVQGSAGPDPRDVELEALREKVAKEEARKAKQREKAKAREESPPPFSIGEAFESIASKAGPRFSPGVERDWPKGTRIAVAVLIRTYPTRAEWERLGAWLLAGGEAFRGALGPAWAASKACSDAMAKARDWEARGGGPIGEASRAAFALSAPDPPRLPAPPVPRVLGVSVPNPAKPGAAGLLLETLRAQGTHDASH